METSSGGVSGWKLHLVLQAGEGLIRWFKLVEA